MFATGPYAHETQLVSPPVFSTEPAFHCPTHSTSSNYSPDVPFAHFLTSTSTKTKASQDADFFCPATFAQFYLDQNPPFPDTGGRLSISKESDTTISTSTSHAAAGNGHHHHHNRYNKEDVVEELEAYRASFGFSADDIVTTTPQYVEISNVMDDSFTITPFPSNKASSGGAASEKEGLKVHMSRTNSPNNKWHW